MAAMAASLMWRGVAKWGSPAPKSISWAPWARSLAASAVTAMVAETSMRPIRSAKILVTVGAVIPTILAEPCPFKEAPNVGFTCGGSAGACVIALLEGIDGCPMFAPAYVGRKRWAQPNDRFRSIG